MRSQDNSNGADDHNGDESALAIVSRIISNWRNGQSPDALKFLAEHPQLADQKSLVLDLAYEEYCLRKEKGESLTASEFCEKFADWQRSLARLIDVHEYLDHHPEFVPAQEQSKWPQPGDNFLGFEIERKIGSGAFARVYVARDPSLGYRLVALKVSRGGASEAMTLGRLTHDNIVPVNSVQSDAQSGLTAICMPYQGEATLIDLLEAGFKSGGRPQTGDVILAVARRRAPSAVEPTDEATLQQLRRMSYVDAVVELTAQLAAALKYAHSRGVLHRDLKPSNVLLAPDGEPKLLDFNLSWDTELTGARLGGTVPYMSPEQVKSVLLGTSTDRRGGIDQRSDLFSLGVLVYELLTGVTPFGTLNGPGNERVEAEGLLNRQRTGALPISELNPDVDPSLGEIVAWCLEYDPADRPQTAADFEAALVRFQRPIARLKRAMQRRKRLVTVSTIAALMLAAALGAWFASRPPFPERAFQAGLASYEEGDWDGAAQWWSEGIAADRPTAELLFARALANIRREELELAAADLDLARRLSTHGEILANLAYCRARTENFSSCELWCREALRRGFVNAALYNNLGYSRLRIIEPAAAKTALDMAIEKDTDLACAYQNRALTGAELFVDDPHNWKIVVSDIERALELAPDNWSIWRDAAIVVARSPVEQPDDRDRMVTYLSKALELGGSLEAIRQEKSIDRFKADPKVAELLASPYPADVTEPLHVVLPCPNPLLR